MRSESPAFLRRSSDAELSQGIAAPEALVDRLPGFTTSHLGTADARAVVQLAKDEQWRRRDIEVRRLARMANYLAMGSLGVAVFALIASAIAAYAAYATYATYAAYATYATYAAYVALTHAP
jgi:hypothetical protein